MFINKFSDGLFLIFLVIIEKFNWWFKFIVDLIINWFCFDWLSCKIKYLFSFNLLIGSSFKCFNEVCLML